MADASVVVAAYQAGRTIGQTLQSLLAARPQGVEVQLLVVDDGSTDDTASVAEAQGVTVIRRDHAGRAAALNAGIAAATANVVLFTDADCLVPENWIGATLAVLRNRDGVGGNLRPSRFTAVELAKVLRYVEEFETDIELRPPYDGVCLNGNNMAIRKQALDAVGGFDEGYIHGADADLTRRLLDAGFNLLRTTRTHTVHLKVDTLGSFLRTMFKRGSTIRFTLNKETPGTLARALLLSPLKWLAVDFSRVRRLRVFGTKVRTGLAWLAPWINLLGGWANGIGRIVYYRRFRRENP